MKVHRPSTARTITEGNCCRESLSWCAFLAHENREPRRDLGRMELRYRQVLCGEKNGGAGRNRTDE